MRFLLDFDAEEFDLACAKVIHPCSSLSNYDMSEQLRVGKVMQTTALNALHKGSVYSWVIQILGSSYNFYTAHSTKRR